VTVVTYKVKSMFFDRPAVAKAIGKANARALGKAGAFVRRRARSSLRRRKSVSMPGHPPSVHSSDSVKTLKNILFAYEPTRTSVVVGPVKLGGGGYVVPAVHEFGGAATIARGSGRRRRKVAARYPKRPYMKPALDKEAPKFATLWAGQVRA
jgi:hypothetical protein